MYCLARILNTFYLMNKKYTKLIISILLDAIGFFTSLPLDFFWAPLSGFIMTKLYPGKKGKIGGLISFIEEITPVIDVIPTFTFMWIYTNYFEKENEQQKDVVIDI